MEKQSPTLILLPKHDYCHRYRPAYDRSTFQQQIEDTQAEVVNYFATQILKQYNEYRNTTKTITYAFWASTLGLAVFAHKIKFLQRHMGERKWLMFGFRMGTLVMPYLLMQRIMQDAEEEEITTIYKQIKPHYIRYKLTGDITQLSGKVELEEGTLPSSHPSTQLVSDNARQVE